MLACAVQEECNEEITIKYNCVHIVVHVHNLLCVQLNMSFLNLCITHVLSTLFIIYILFCYYITGLTVSCMLLKMGLHFLTYIHVHVYNVHVRSYIVLWCDILNDSSAS